MLTRPINWLNRRPKIAATAPSAETLSALGDTIAAFTATDSTPPHVIGSGAVPDLSTTPDSNGYQWNRAGICGARLTDRPDSTSDFVAVQPSTSNCAPSMVA